MRHGSRARPIIRRLSQSWPEIMRSACSFGDQDGAPLAQSLIAHSLIYVLVGSLAFRVAAWFGFFIDISLVFNATLVICWIVASFHRRKDHLCARCMHEVPADAPTRAERQWPLLRFSHFTVTIAGTAVLACVVFGLALVADLLGGAHAARLLYIPGDLWVTAVIYCEWVHQRLRPWCRYCRPWDDEGDHEPAPDPTDSGTSTPVRT